MTTMLLTADSFWGMVGRPLETRFLTEAESETENVENTDDTSETENENKELTENAPDNIRKDKQKKAVAENYEAPWYEYDSSVSAWW